MKLSAGRVVPTEPELDILRAVHDPSRELCTRAESAIRNALGGWPSALMPRTVICPRAVVERHGAPPLPGTSGWVSCTNAAGADCHVRAAVFRQVGTGPVAGPGTGHPGAVVRLRDLPGVPPPDVGRFTGHGGV